MRRKFSLVFILMIIINVVSVSALDVKKDNYILDVEGTTIKSIKEYENNNLIKVYFLEGVVYDEATPITTYLDNKISELSINNNNLIRKELYKDNKLYESIKYEGSTIYSNDNVNNRNKYYQQFLITNNNLKEVVQYKHSTTKLDKRYVMHNNIAYNGSIKGARYLYVFSDDGYIARKEEYLSNGKLSKKNYYYTGTKYTNETNKLKSSYVFQNGYVVKSYGYYNNMNKVQNYITYYPKSRENASLTKNRQFITSANTKGYITGKTMRTKGTQRVSRIYKYNKNTIIFKNEAKRLNRINYYTYNRGKNKYTGYKTYKNGRLTNTYVKLKGVPYYNQFTSGFKSGCEMFSVKMALGYKGKKVSNKTLYKKMKRSNNKPKRIKGRWVWANPDKMFLGNPKGTMKHNANWGINPKGIQPLANQYRPSYAKHNFSTNQIREELLKGNPVVVWSTFKWAKPAGYFKYYDKEGNKRYTYGNFHVMLVVGMDKKYIYFSDPAIGQKKVSISKFNKSYAPYGKKALVIT